MAKKRTQRKKSGKTPHKKKRPTPRGTSVPGSITNMTKSYEELYDTWNDFATRIDSRISENIDNQQKTYEDFYNKWMNFTEKMGTRITKTKPGHKYREAYDVWKNYANRINHRLTKMMSKGQDPYKKLDKYWQAYSETLSQEINRAASGEIKPGEYKEIYEAWTGFAGEMQEYIRSTTDLSTEDLQDITRVWYDFSKKMQNLVTDLTEDGDTVDELTDLWTTTSRDIGDTLETMLKENNGDIEKLQRTWFDHCRKVEKEIMDTSQRMGVDYDELWKWYFDNQKAWYGWWSRSVRSDNNDLKKDVDDLRRRVATIEKKYRK